MHHNRSLRTRTVRTAARVGRSLLYKTISGQVLVDLAAGKLTRVSDYLARLGLDDQFIDRYGSWAGRHIAKAYRKLTSVEPTRCWIRNDAGRWIHVAVYTPTHKALPAGIASYPRTRDLALEVAA